MSSGIQRRSGVVKARPAARVSQRERRAIERRSGPHGDGLAEGLLGVAPALGMGDELPDRLRRRRALHRDGQGHVLEGRARAREVELVGDVERAADGGLVFRSPSGRVIEHAPRPPRVAEDAAAVIASEHGDAGLRIDAQTAAIRYTHRPDYGACVAAAT